MPGPQNKRMRGGNRVPATNSPNAKTVARLKARQAAFSPSNDKYRAGYRLPGSENRKK